VSTSFSEKAAFRLQLLAVALGVLLLAAKFIAYLYTNSNTILTDAAESVVNVVAGVFALYSLYLSSQPKDHNHPYGHGKVEFISAAFEGILIALAGVMIIGKSALSFLQPHKLEHLTLGSVIILSAGIVNYMLGFLLVRTGKKHHFIVLTADGQHLKSDAYSSFGILGGLLLIILTKLNFLDNVVAIIFGFVIIFMGIRLLRKSVAGIMDEADDTLIASLVELLNKHRKTQWIDIHNLRVIQFGNRLHVDCHVTLPWYYTLNEAHHEIKEIGKLISDNQTRHVEFFIHGDPCVKESCKICALADCPVRQQKFQQHIEWNITNISSDKKHAI
jgi:cation diffusion facilitator family transporter